MIYLKNFDRAQPFTLLARHPTADAWKVYYQSDTMENCKAIRDEDILHQGVTNWSWCGPTEIAMRMLEDPNYDPEQDDNL